MPEAATVQSKVAQAREEQSSRARWFRLFRSAFWTGSFVALISLASDIANYVQGYSYTLDVGFTTRDLILEWLTKALVVGLFYGFFFAFPMWLAREQFPRPKSNSAIVHMTKA